MQNRKEIELKQEQIDNQIETIKDQEIESEKNKRIIEEQNILISKAKDTNQQLTTQMHDMKIEMEYKQKEMELRMENQKKDDESFWKNLVAKCFTKMVIGKITSTNFGGLFNPSPQEATPSNIQASSTSATTTSSTATTTAATETSTPDNKK